MHFYFFEVFAMACVLLTEMCNIEQVLGENNILFQAVLKKVNGPQPTRLPQNFECSLGAFLMLLHYLTKV